MKPFPLFNAMRLDMRLGVLGVGDLTEKMIRGLYRSERDIHVWLAPRNRERADALAKDFGCRVMASNQDVVDAVDVVLIGVRPAQLEELAAEVVLRPEQSLISVVAGVSTRELRTLFRSERCSRAMLSAASEINRPTVAVYPAGSMAEDLLAPFGNLVVLDQEDHFELATVGACMNGWWYFLFDEIEQWFVSKGLAEEQARELALSSVEDCVAYARHKKPVELRDVDVSIATPSTFTAKGLDVLKEHGGQAAWTNACEAVFELLNKKA